MNKILVAVLFLCGIIVIGGLYILSNSSSKSSVQTTPQRSSISEETTQPDQNEEVNYKAAFAIYTNGVFRVFTATMYHNLSEDVYIQADNPNIVHVKKSGVTWNDFFKTLPFSLTKGCLTTGTRETFCTNQTKTLKFYLNGVRNDNLLDTEIKPNDKALISYGSETDSEIAKQLEKLSSILY